MSTLLIGALAGPLECPYAEVNSVYCNDNSDCGAQSYCKIDSGLAGVCVSSTYECPSNKECFKINDAYTCRVPDNRACTYTSQCAHNQKCIGGKCTCTNVPDFGVDLCLIPQDGLLYVNCTAQGRTCYGASNVAYPYGSCLSMNLQPSNNDADCYTNSDPLTTTTNSKYQCDCRKRFDMFKCKHYTVLKKAMIDYKNCILPYTSTCSSTNHESCCNAGANACRSILNNAAVSQYYPAMGDIVANAINYQLSPGSDCQFKSIMSDQCEVNLYGVY